jgi:hypothetical protein
LIAVKQVTEFDWASAAARLLKAEIARSDITLAKLAARLQRMGIAETESSVKNKLYRGTFSMTFFLQCMQALGHTSADLHGVLPDGAAGKELDRVSRS